jgi:hypothetical protein
MNEVLMRMRSRKKIMQITSKYPHLTLLLEVMTQSKGATVVAEDITVNDRLTIQFAEDGKRIRKVVRRSNCRMTGKFPSTKNGRMMHWESQYELGVFQILEISPLVAAYSEQPAEIKYTGMDGIQHLHFPDILVELTCGINLFIEVKPESAATDQDLANRTTLLAGLLKPMGYRYLMILPEQVDCLAYIENAKHLLLYCKSPMPETVWEMVRLIFSNESSLQLSTLIKLIGHSDARSWIFRLLMLGDICCDLSMPITSQTKISWHNQGEI